jgi:hypothetical protein
MSGISPLWENSLQYLTAKLRRRNWEPVENISVARVEISACCTCPRDLASAASATSIWRFHWPSYHHAWSRPPSRGGCRAGPASLACSTRRSNGHASIRCLGSSTGVPPDSLTCQHSLPVHRLKPVAVRPHSNWCLLAPSNSAGKKFAEARDCARIFGDEVLFQGTETRFIRVAPAKAAENQT